MDIFSYNFCNQKDKYFLISISVVKLVSLTLPYQRTKSAAQSVTEFSFPEMSPTAQSCSQNRRHDAGAGPELLDQFTGITLYCSNSKPVCTSTLFG